MHSTSTFPFAHKLAEDATAADPGERWVLAESVPGPDNKTSLGLWWRPSADKTTGFPNSYGRPAWFNVPDPLAAVIRVALPIIQIAYPPKP